MWDMEETRYRTLLYWYKQEIWQCKIILAHTGSIHDLKFVPPSLTSLVGSVASPMQCSGEIPFHGTREMGQPSIAQKDTSQAHALAPVQEITQLLPPPSCATSGSISLIDSDGASVAGDQGELPSTTMKQRQGGSITPILKSVNNSTQESRMTLPSQVCSTSPVWSYYSNWSNDLSPPCKLCHLLYQMVITPVRFGLLREH